MAVEERFWNKVNQHQKPNACWIWSGTMMPQGYGVMYVGKQWNDSNRIIDYAHRISWRLKNGRIPKGLSVLHGCDNRRCVNPDHLRVGTQKDNVDDMVKRNRFGGGARKGLFGALNPASKLTEEDVLAIRCCYQTGRWGYKRLAEMFGVTPMAVKKIVTGKTWKHIA